VIKICSVIIMWSADLVNIKYKLLRRVRKIAKLASCPSIRMEQFGSHWTDFHEI